MKFPSNEKFQILSIRSILGSKEVIYIYIDYISKEKQNYKILFVKIPKQLHSSNTCTPTPFPAPKSPSPHKMNLSKACQSPTKKFQNPSAIKVEKFQRLIIPR